MAPTRPLFTILLAVHRPPVCLPFAIESVLDQTLESFELLVVCDGAPAETVACAEEFAQRDKRIGVLSFAKGERNGEAYWHLALQGARGRYVVHIEDDDLWFPNHLDEMEKLLATVDFGHLMHSYVNPSDGRIMVLWADIASEAYRQKFLDEPFNRIGFSFVGYRLSAYRRLPEGWAPSPPGFWPDLWMWRKFFRMPDFRFGTRAVITALSITSHLRDHDISQGRHTESRDWLDRIQDPVQRAEIIEAAWRYVVSECIGLADWALRLDADLTAARTQLEQTAAEHVRIVGELVACQTLLSRGHVLPEQPAPGLAPPEIAVTDSADAQNSIAGLRDILAATETRLLAVERQGHEIGALRLQIESAAADLETIKLRLENPRSVSVRGSVALGQRGKWLRKLQRAVRAKPSPGV